MELIQMIDNYLEKKEGKERDEERFHISELATSKRILFERFINPDKKEKPKPQLKRIFENGNFVHQRYYKYFAEMGILRAVEVQAVDNDLFTGTADCIISTKDGVPWVVDIKSCNSWVFKKLQDMKPEHRVQILFYMYYLNIENGLLLYENKDDQNIKIFKIHMDNTNKILVETMIEDFKQLKQDIESGIMPEESPIILEELHGV